MNWTTEVPLPPTPTSAKVADMAFLIIFGLLAGLVGAATLGMASTVLGEIMGVLIIGFGSIYLGLAAVLEAVKGYLNKQAGRSDEHLANIRVSSSSCDLRLAHIGLHTSKVSTLIDRCYPAEQAQVPPEQPTE